MNRQICLLVSGIAFVIVPFFAGKLTPLSYEGGRSRNEQARMARNSSSVANILGELRTSMSDIMYIKTERYLHSGIGYSSHMDEVLSVSSMTGKIDHNQASLGDGGHKHAGEDKNETLIPVAQSDFRGFVGHLQRQVKPYRAPGTGHEHTDGRELLPWFRLMTLSDPHFIRGYTVGGWWLMRRNFDESVKFIDEGIANNPDSFEVHLMRGHILLERGRELSGEDFFSKPPVEAMAWIWESHKSFVKAADLASKVRPPVEKIVPENTKWTSYMEGDANAAVNMSILIERKYGDPNRAEALARRFQQAFPDNRRVLSSLQKP